MTEKEGRSSGDCSSSGRGDLYLGGWSKKRKRTMRVATHGYPNATVTDGGECITKDELIAAEALLVLQSELSTSTKRVKKSSFPLHDPILPVDFKAQIRELTGESQEEKEAKFLYEKKLYKSDITRGENRFLIPLKQIKNEFLTEEEKQELGRRLSGGKKCQKIEVMLIQPSLEVCTINLKKWDMGDRSKGKLNENYVLVTTWRKVVEENQLNIGTTVQLWSFRKHGDLCFALVRKGQ